MRHRRVTFTVPADVLKTADALAKRLGRSRSWVVTDALKRYAADEPPASRQVSEAAASYRAAMDGARAFQRDADLRLTPEQRLQAAEELVEEAARLRPRRRGAVRQVVHFESLEDWWEWKKRESRP